MTKNTSISLFAALAGAMLLSVDSGAYPTYSANRDATRCRACHGDFRSDNYISKTDKTNWGNLHDKHRLTMLSGDCNTCHMGSGSLRFPVKLNQSVGGTGFSPIGCVGCHGRAEDAGHDDRSAGLGAGLRRHHTSMGVGICMNCHLDASPGKYKPSGESVLPPYYFVPDPFHPNKPTDSCNVFEEENVAGAREGLDNDGNTAYDIFDPDCKPLHYKVEICHVEPKKKDVTLSVNAGSLAGHLAHGDTLGACAEQ